MELTDIQARGLEELLDRQAIRHRLEEYARGIDRVAPDLIEGAYHAESWDLHGSFDGSGSEFARNSEFADRRHDASNVSAHHMLGQTHIELDGDVARCETYFLRSGLRDHDGDRRFGVLAGRYLDRFERVDGEWRIRVRRVVADMAHEQVELPRWPPIDDFVRGARWPEDAVFRFDEMVVPPES